MIVRQLEEAKHTDRRVVAPNWESTRLLLQADRMGFSLHVTTIYAGTETRMWYRHHVEAVLCIGGEGELEALEEKRIYPIRAGTLYALDRHDRHILRATTQLTMVCVFNPPVVGQEVHDEEGAYPASRSAQVS